VDFNFLAQYPELDAFRASRILNTVSSDIVPIGLIEETDATPDELIRSAYARLDAALRELLLSRILKSPPAFFERLIVRLLVAMGFGGKVDATAEAIGRSGDDGVDGVIDQDALGLDRVYLQAKRYTPGNSVGPNAIRFFLVASISRRLLRAYLLPHRPLRRAHMILPAALVCGLYLSMETSWRL
jgi:restriction system protein